MPWRLGYVRRIRVGPSRSSLWWLLVVLLAGFDTLSQAHANNDRIILAAYCVGYYKYTVQEMQRSLNESRQWGRLNANRPQEEMQEWQRVVDTSERELRGETLKLERLQKYLSQSLGAEDTNDLSLAIVTAERRAQDDLRACYTEAAPAHEVPPSCKRVQHCRDIDDRSLLSTETEPDR
jgi:hypothetical protein